MVQQRGAIERKKQTMVEVEEIELDLGLSIGGTFTKQQPKSDEEEEEKKKKRQKRDKTEDEDYHQNGLWTTAPFHVQFLPFNNNNGFAALPCREKIESQVPMWVPTFPANGCRPEQNGETDRKGKSNDGYFMCSASVVSKYQSSSHEDGGSADSHSHSARSSAEPTQLNNSKENYITSQPEQIASFQHGSNADWRNQREKENHPNTTQPEPTEENSSNPSSKETKVGMGKPPKPVTQTSSSLPQMPYVSTTGNGPNGKTVNGFLYKYTKSEVSIVCVCHGSTFSPAEFVQHAGGTDISHPLRHITVIPYAFG